ncbi:MAG TPA: HAMP domain-containing sensor histidine kinase [Candidatus Pacearchaeota archaeon]|nr:HAMP domain-containing histidine kinase [Candidatus Parcubacteria bacterium]HNP79272.1 HAMP domain-containing sensor histidine kinase [Candidatus Pacearchaeota archaeon]
MNKPSKVNFLKDNQQVIYSVFLMIFVPAVIIFNTYLCTDLFKRTIDQGLQEKAVAVAESINVGMVNILDSPEEMQTFIETWRKYNSDTQSMEIFYKDIDGFKLVSSLEKKEIGRIDTTTLYTIAWDKNWPSAQKIYDANSNSHYWRIAAPLKNNQGERKALLVMYSSTAVVDQSMSEALKQSYFIVIVSVLVIVLLLFANARIFERAILYNKMKEIDQMKDEFISMASHELRTPITVIKGYIEMITMDKESSLSKDSKEYLSIVNISTERLNNLVEDLLDVSRIEQGRLKMNIQPMNIWQTVEDVVKELKIGAEEKGLVLSSVLDQGATDFINADKDRFKQVLINIIGNSIKYTPSGSIEIRGMNRNKKLAIFIKDTGIGMSAKEREGLFNKFYRVKNKKTVDIGGTGLGLWITKQIVELMEGTIIVDSIEGTGTQVTLEFPLTNKI